MDKLERDWLKLVVLLVDMAASFVLTAISLSKHRKESHSDVQVEAVLSGVTIVVAVLVYALCVILISVSVQTQSLLTAGGGLFFFIGDNLPPLVGEYGKQVSCDQECVEVVQILGIIMLGIATVTYIPVLYDSVPIYKGTHCMIVCLYTKVHPQTTKEESHKK